jgi:Pyridoxamine 5'-phosphate oxidase
VPTWSEVSAAAPELAAAVEGRFRVHRHALLATLRADGSPRLSGIETRFGAELLLGMMGGSRKALDLRRDPRLALHSAPVDLALAEGDAKLSGTAAEVLDEAALAAFVAAEVAERGQEPPAPFHLFRVDVTELVLTTVAGDLLVVERWEPTCGQVRTERR